MASREMVNIYGTNYGYEDERLIDSEATEYVDQAAFVPSNVGQLTCGIKRISGTGGYKVQVSFSTRANVDADNGVWFDWDLDGMDSNGFIHDDETQFWVPIPSHYRFVVEAGIGTQVNFALRAN